MSSSSSLVNSVLSALGSSSSGIDVTSAVAAIISTDEAGMRQLQSQQTTLAAQTAAIQQLETQASAVTDDLNSLGNILGPLTSLSATSSNASVLTATAATGTASGNYSIVVNSLATTASAYTNEVASSSTALGTGGFEITEGGKTTTITTGGSVNTLDQLVSSINSQSLGVTASVVTDNNGSRLSLASTNSGQAASFSVTNATGALTFTSAAGTDASITVNNVPITSSSNTVTQGVSGLRLNLLAQAPGTTINVSVAQNSSSIVSAVSTFINDYNTLIANVNSQFAYNASTSSAGTLSGDSTTEGLQSALLASTNYSYSGGAYPSLASLGVSTNADGTLTLDASTLQAAVATNPSAVTQFFQGTALDGFADTLQNTLNTYVDPSQGAFTLELKSIASESTDLGNQITSEESYYATLTTTLTTKYNQIDIELQQLPITLQQTDALLGFNTSSSSSSNG